MLAFGHMRLYSGMEIRVWSWMLWNISFPSPYVSRNFEGSRLEFRVWQIFHCSVAPLNKIAGFYWSIIRRASCLAACRLDLVTGWFYQQRHCWECQRGRVDSETERLLHLSWLSFRPEMKLRGGSWGPCLCCRWPFTRLRGEDLSKRSPPLQYHLLKLFAKWY